MYNNWFGINKIQPTSHSQKQATTEKLDSKWQNKYPHSTLKKNDHQKDLKLTIKKIKK